MRPPISFVYGNLVFGATLDDVWAVFFVPSSSYEWLSEDAKRARLLTLMSALEVVEADVQILRVGRRWDLDGYLCELERGSAGGHMRASRHYACEHTEHLRDVGAAQPAVFFLVSLRDPERDVSSYVSQAAEQHPREWLRSIRRALSVRDRRLLNASELERAHIRADQVHARLGDFLNARPARGVELQWLVRRAFCRGLGEPLLDGLHEPRALAFEHNGEALLAPLEGDVVRWMDGYVEHRGRSLRVESELGVSWQAQLVLGALPERATFPGARVELMFAPVESLPFVVDLSLNARFLPNELALRIARRRVQDADQIVRAESDGDQGVSDLGYQRTQEARDLLAYLQASSRPPLLRATLAVAIGAEDEQQLSERVEMCRRAYGEIRLHRPLGDQLALFIQQLPGQRTRVAGYDDTLTTEQVAAMMPTATHAVGSRHGFYLGHTLSGSRQPVRFNLREGSERDRNTAILSVGALGSGKTTLAQKLKYEGFLQGARVIDCDPKGDHRFHLLDEVAPHAETITLRPDPALRGMLDPLRVAPEHLRQDAAVSFLRDLLPGRAEAAWETAVVAAVDVVLRRAPQPTCMEVVRALCDGQDTDVQVGNALAVYARSGLTQLGFADPAVALPPVGARQVTYIPIRDLPGPEPGTPRSEYTQSERVGVQIVRLIAMFAMQLMSRERERLKLFSFDEGWRLLGDPVGRTLLASLQRMGRSELAVPIVSTQLVTDALIGERESLGNLLGATFVFGMRSEAEAARALTLLALDPEDRRARERLLELEAGRCLLRDHSGRVEAIQVEVIVPSLLRAFSTTPRAASAQWGSEDEARATEAAAL
ncbi:MAG TPA: ATP-binding protein [Solirubrobacteraceae bacterium]|nr:ATP-binding protein [Solirubrobacteraceae bacterium]